MNLKQVLYRNLTLQGLSQAVGLAAGMAVTLILARSLGAAEFGAFSYVFAYLYFWQALNDLGINTIVLREVSKDESRAAEIIGAMIAFRLILAAATVVVASIVAIVTPMSPEVRPSVLTFIWLLPLSAINLTQTVFQMKLDLGPMTVAEIVNRASGLILILMALSAGFGLVGVFVALLIAEAIGATMVFVSSRRYVHPRIHVDIELSKEILRSSLPLGVAVLLTAVVNRIDFLMLERMASLEQLGLYSAAYKITSLFERFPGMVVATLYPAMSKLAVTDLRLMIAIYRKTVLRLALIALPAAVLITWLAPEIMRLFGGQYADAARGLRVLVWSSVCLYLAIVGGHVLIALGHERVNLVTLIAGAATNIAFNVFWIPRYGYVGAAWATVLAFVVILVTTVWAVERCLRHVPKPV